MSGAELIPDLSVIVHGWIVKGGLVWVKEIVGMLRQFKGVFGYRFGRLDFDLKALLIPQR